MQVENEIHVLLIGSASVVGDNTKQRLGCYYRFRRTPTTEKVSYGKSDASNNFHQTHFAVFRLMSNI